MRHEIQQNMLGPAVHGRNHGKGGWGGGIQIPAVGV